jgi:hypothetical protein
MLNAKSRMTLLLMIFPVSRRDSFVSQRNAYAAAADKKLPEKPTSKADYVQTVKNKPLALNTNDFSLKAVVEKDKPKGQDQWARHNS